MLVIGLSYGASSDGMNNGEGEKMEVSLPCAMLPLDPQGSVHVCEPEQPQCTVPPSMLVCIRTKHTIVHKRGASSLAEQFLKNLHLSGALVGTSRCVSPLSLIINVPKSAIVVPGCALSRVRQLGDMVQGGEDVDRVLDKLCKLSISRRHHASADSAP